MIRLIFVLLSICACSIVNAASDLTLVKDGKATYSIHAVTENQKHAAVILNKYIAAISGVTLPVVSLNKGLQIVFAQAPNAKFNVDQMKTDAFCIEMQQQNVYIYSNSKFGLQHAVYVFIERCLHVNKFATQPMFEKRKTITIDSIRIVEEPAYTTRSLYYTGTNDAEYISWHGLNGKCADSVKDQWGMWVHTFKNLIPDSVYFDKHPEYFALNGVRRRSQLCLSNEDVLQTVIKNLRAMMQKDTTSLYWSVSQNDNFEYCTCSQCKTTDSIEGSQSGTMLRFVNKVAAAFPQKIISTLAYQYTRKPPAITKPAKNVNIMFCSIECGRHLPIEDDPQAASFRSDFEGWSKLTDNIMVWDYVVQFSNYVSPFPNIHVLQPNIQYFYEHGVRHIFEQASGSNWSDNMELKSYLIAALLWNPYVDVDSLVERYAALQYGAGADDMITYMVDMEQQLNQSKAPLDIYSNPVTPNNTWLKPNQLSEYESYFEAALASAHPSKHQAIKKQKLPLQYARLEQAKFYGTGNLGVFENISGKWVVRQQLQNNLKQFIADCEQLHIKHLNESNYSIYDYYKAWQRIFDAGLDGHKAMLADIKLTPGFSLKYPAKGIQTLNDGSKGFDDYSYNWLGWEGSSMQAIINLKQIDSVQSVAVDFMQFQKSWIFYPDSVSFYISVDSINYQLLATKVAPTLTADNNFKAHTFKAEFKKQPAQYIKVVAKNIGQCPVWHIGAGHPSWIFCDEIIVH